MYNPFSAVVKLLVSTITLLGFYIPSSSFFLFRTPRGVTNSARKLSVCEMFCLSLLYYRHPYYYYCYNFSLFCSVSPCVDDSITNATSLNNDSIKYNIIIIILLLYNSRGE